CRRPRMGRAARDDLHLRAGLAPRRHHGGRQLPRRCDAGQRRAGSHALPRHRHRQHRRECLGHRARRRAVHRLHHRQHPRHRHPHRGRQRQHLPQRRHQLRRRLRHHHRARHLLAGRHLRRHPAGSLRVCGRVARQWELAPDDLRLHHHRRVVMSRTVRLGPAYLLGASSRGLGGGIAPKGPVPTTVSGGSGQGTAPSPPGRHPTYVWTPEWQYTAEQMQANNHWYYNNMLVNANKTGTAQERYDDWGGYCAYIYQITGDASYAAKAWTRLQTRINIPAAAVGGNRCREYFTWGCILVDWIWPALNGTQRQQAMDYLKEWADFAQRLNGAASSSGGYSLVDSDPLFGYHGGIVALHYFNEPENSLY